MIEFAPGKIILPGADYYRLSDIVDKKTAGDIYTPAVNYYLSMTIKSINCLTR